MESDGVRSRAGVASLKPATDRLEGPSLIPLWPFSYEISSTLWAPRTVLFHQAPHLSVTAPNPPPGFPSGILFREAL